ncbi:MAG TPA: type VI secretion system baseplate subunit TssF [Burkholderiaceae bacterium]|nr:type VI secretion system baseplate subunit TssF [Burkholderiaceae bacterium]
MDDLLPYYERELSFLRSYSREFAQQYPKAAGRLLMSGEVCEDPHVERMIEAVALMNARISKKLEDDYPEFTEALLEVMFPQYLRTFPSCSIARFDGGPALAQMTSATVIPRGTTLLSRPVRGVPCTFRTAYDITLAPVRVASARFDSIVSAPEGVRLASKSQAHLAIEFSLLGDAAQWSTLKLDRLRVFLDGEPSFAATLRDALLKRCIACHVEPAGSKRWVALNHVPLQSVGFDDEHALIDIPPQSHPAYRLLTEYFAFPEKFNFVDIPLDAIVATLPGGTRGFTLHFVLTDIRSDSAAARVLDAFGPQHIRLGCTPVVNLFAQRGDPIRVTHEAAHYPVVADARRAHAFEVYSIDRVKLVKHTPQGESIVEFRPFYSLRHGESVKAQGHYWFAHRDELVARRSPGYELEISIVDIDFDPALPATETLSLELTCCNRDLPSSLAYGAPGGDLFIEGAMAREVNLLRKPTAPLRFERGQGARWRLVSQLALNRLSITQTGLSAFKEILKLHDLPRSPASMRLIEAIVGIEHKPTTAWLAGNPFATIVRGIEVRLSVEEEGLVGIGVHLFGEVLSRFLGLYVQANSFTQLVIVSSRTSDEILRCSPRSGDTPLA